MKHTSRQVHLVEDLSLSDQYTYTGTIGNACYIRARNAQGEPLYLKRRLQPTYYLPSKSGTFVGVDGRTLKACPQESIEAGRTFLKRHEGQVYGDIQPEYLCLAEVLGDRKEVFHDFRLLYIWDVDIEVDKDDTRGFSSPEDPFNPIVAITVIWSHLGEHGTVVYGCADYTPPEHVTYIRCQDESELLVRFLEDLRGDGDYPDILTGWNSGAYDYPYIYGRLKKLFTEEFWSFLSPLRRIQLKTQVDRFGKHQTIVDIKGIQILDYMELYKKHRGVQQESYRLDYIASVELGRRKISYAEARTLSRLLRTDPQKFFEYNVNDAQLVFELDAKLKFLDLVIGLGYEAKANFIDTFKVVRLWDIMIFHELRAAGKQIPPRKIGDKDSQYEGAFVKDPNPGQYKWLVSFDVTSMYPNIMRSWNLSPETYTGQKVKNVTAERLLQQENLDSFREGLKQKNLCMAANGALMHRDEQGFLPIMLGRHFEERIRYKNLMKAAEKEREKKKQEGATPEVLRPLDNQVAAYNNQQAVRKILINGVYGAMGSPYFRFYETDIAEAVTLTGQYVIQSVAHAFNVYLNQILHTNTDYVIAGDTDSCYLCLETVVDRFRKAHPDASRTAIVKMLDQFCRVHLQPIIGQTFTCIGDDLNVLQTCLAMGREVIADKGVWTAKKRYMLNVLNKEGIMYETPKLKIMGVEAVKSSTPSICRDLIREGIRLLMNESQEAVWEHIEQARHAFFKAPFEDIAFPKSCNNLAKYQKATKGVPFHVRAALTFNDALKEQHLTTEYPLIEEGEKIKYAYLREPNRFHSNVMGAPGGCPVEWKIEEVIDYEMQFQKSFLEPFGEIVRCAGWTLEPKLSLLD